VLAANSARYDKIWLARQLKAVIPFQSMSLLRLASRLSVLGLALGFALLPMSLVAAGDDPVVGRWSGQVDEKSGTDTSKYPMTIQFDSASHGSTDYSSLQCGGELSGGSTGNNTYSYTEKITTGSCADGGHVEVKVVNHDTISFLWSSLPGGKGDTVSGTLTRQ
jgi:hypothetical protein